MATTPKTTFVEPGPEGLRFRFEWPGSPTLAEARHEVPWGEVAAVAISRRASPGVIARRSITFYLDDGWYEVSDAPWVEGWERVASDLHAYLPLNLPDWRAVWEAMRPGDDPIFLFR